MARDAGGGRVMRVAVTVAAAGVGDVVFVGAVIAVVIDAVAHSLVDARRLTGLTRGLMTCDAGGGRVVGIAVTIAAGAIRDVVLVGAVIAVVIYAVAHG